jgi:hypothetical protein
MQPTDGQPAPGRDPTASSASIHIQQTVNKHGSQQFTLKSRPVMHVGVQGTARPMRTASHTVRDPVGPYRRRAHSASPDRLDGRHNSDGVKVTYQKTHDLSASVFLSFPPSAQALLANHPPFRSEPPGGCTSTGIEGTKDGGARGPPQQPREPPWLEHPRILGPCLNNCMHSVERHSTTPMLLSSWRTRWVRFQRAAISLPQMY